MEHARKARGSRVPVRPGSKAAQGASVRHAADGDSVSGPWHADPARSRAAASTTCTRRGTGGLVFFEDDADCQAQYGLYGAATARHGWKIHAQCLMQTHHHVLIEAPHEALVRGMHLLGTCLRRCGSTCGATDSATRPPAGSARVRSTPTPTSRASRSTSPTTRSTPDSSTTRERSAWTSHRATLGLEPRPPWLDPDWLPRLFASNRHDGIARYAHHVDRQAAALVAARPGT